MSKPFQAGDRSNKPQAIELIEESIRKAKSWMYGMGLKMSISYTELTMFKNSVMQAVQSRW